jgi:hypothetical protein
MSLPSNAVLFRRPRYCEAHASSPSNFSPLRPLTPLVLRYTPIKHSTQQRLRIETDLPAKYLRDETRGIAITTPGASTFLDASPYYHPMNTGTYALAISRRLRVPVFLLRRCVLVVEGGGKWGRLMLSLMATFARSRMHRDTERLKRQPVSRAHCHGAVLASFARQVLKNHSRAQTTREPRVSSPKGGTGNCGLTVRHHSP